MKVTVKYFAVCRQMLNRDEEDMELAKSEMSDMVDLLFESLQISFSSRSKSEDETVFQCEVTVPDLQ